MQFIAFPSFPRSSPQVYRVETLMQARHMVGLHKLDIPPLTRTASTDFKSKLTGQGSKRIKRLSSHQGLIEPCPSARVNNRSPHSQKPYDSPRQSEALRYRSFSVANYMKLSDLWLYSQAAAIGSRLCECYATMSLRTNCGGGNSIAERMSTSTTGQVLALIYKPW